MEVFDLFAVNAKFSMKIVEIFLSVILLVISSNMFTCDFTSNIINPSKDYVILRRVERLRIILQPFQVLNWKC